MNSKLSVLQTFRKLGEIGTKLDLAAKAYKVR